MTVKPKWTERMSRAFEKAFFFNDPLKKNLTPEEMDVLFKVVIFNPRSIPKHWREVLKPWIWI